MVFCSIWPTELIAMRNKNNVSPANRMVTKSTSATTMLRSLSLRIPRPSPNATLVENIATQRITTAISNPKLSGMPVSLEIKAAMSGVEKPRELPAPPINATMNMPSMSFATQLFCRPFNQ